MNTERGGTVAGNWKDRRMTIVKTVDWFDGFSRNDIAVIRRPTLRLIIAPPFTAIHAARQQIEKYPLLKQLFLEERLSFAAQDIPPFEDEKVRFTGEVHPDLLRDPDLGVRYVIVGHSERRNSFNETDKTIRNKLKMTVAHGLVPILCVGERLDEYEGGKTKDIIQGQLDALGELTDNQREVAIVAYEPVWAIGTGKTANPDVANDICRFIRETSGAGTVVYGGSLTPEIAPGFFKQSDIDGGLPGGASERQDSFFSIARAAANLL